MKPPRELDPVHTGQEHSSGPGGPFWSPRGDGRLFLLPAVDLRERQRGGLPHEVAEMPPPRRPRGPGRELVPPGLHLSLVLQLLLAQARSCFLGDSFRAEGSFRFQALRPKSVPRRADTSVEAARAR